MEFDNRAVEDVQRFIGLYNDHFVGLMEELRADFDALQIALVELATTHGKFFANRETL